MKVPVALALPNGLAVAEIEMIDEVLTLTAVSVQMRPCCPLCGVCASRVHSRYIRKLADLPCGGQHVCLLVCVRKFFCQASTCARKIFAERLTPFVEPWARVTRRLYQIVQVLGLATGGRLGVRVTDRLGIQTCRTTILASNHGTSNIARRTRIGAWNRRFLLPSWKEIRHDPGRYAKPPDNRPLA